MFWNLDNCSPSVVAFFDDTLQKKVTYAAFKEQSDAFVSRLLADKKRLALAFCDNSFQSMLVYVSFLRAGHAVLLVSSQMDASHRQKLIELYTPEIIWSVRTGDVFDGYALEEKRDGTRFFYRQGGEPDGDMHPGLAVLLSTSGTTGSPKLVRLSYKNLQANAASIAAYLDLTDDERAITTLPLHYSYGLSVVNSHLHVGAMVVTTNQSVIRKEFWELFTSLECTSFAGVPFTYRILDNIKIQERDLPSLRTMTQAGGGLELPLVDSFAVMAQRAGGRFFVMYGQTEATARISYVPPERLQEKKGSIGVPVSEGSLSVVKDGRESAEPGVEGELVYRGPNVMMGYADCRADLARGDELEGVLHTGDIGYCDGDGFYYLTGRKKRFLKMLGLRVNLDDVEQELRGELSKNIACSGADDFLVIAVETDSPDDAQRAKRFAMNLYNLHENMVQALAVSSLPYNESGKVDYKQINSMMQ